MFSFLKFFLLICFAESLKTTSTKTYNNINNLKKCFSSYEGYYGKEYYSFSNPTPCNRSCYISKNVNN
jgi:hypothetical protein